MHLSADRHKIILLLARLDELSLKKERVGKYTVSSDWENVKIYLFQHDDKQSPDNFPFHAKQLKEWSTKIPPRIENLERLDAAMLTFFPGRWQGLTKPISDPDKKLKALDFAEAIGIDRAKARYIIDRKYAYDLPSFSALNCSNKDARKFVKHYGGIYYLYRHDVNSFTAKKHTQGLLLRSTLCIRYPVAYTPLGTETSRDYRIRCKVNVPSYNQSFNTDVFKYDGYMMKKNDSWWHWLLQGRDYGRGPGDLIMMYTQHPKIKTGEIEPCLGVMITQNQEKFLVPTISKVFLVKLPEFTLEEDKVLTDIELNKVRGESVKNNNFFKTIPDETEFMSEQCKSLDLADQSDWNDFDKMAVRYIFTEPLPLNLKGLHLL